MLHELSNLTKFGDVITFNSKIYYILGSEGKLIRCSGYNGHIDIPLTISSKFDNAIQHYQSIIPKLPSLSIQILHNDKWILTKYNKIFPDTWKITLWYTKGNFTKLTIDFGNCQKDFLENDTYDTIIGFYNDYQKPFASFIIWFNIHGQDNVKKYRSSLDQRKLILPRLWNSESGSSCSSLDFEYKCLYFWGPKVYLEAAKDSVQEYYSSWTETQENICDFNIKMASADDLIITSYGISSSNDDTRKYYPLTHEIKYDRDHDDDDGYDEL